MKEMATHSSILAWEISWTEEPGKLQVIGSQMTQTRLSTHAQAYQFSSVTVLSDSLRLHVLKHSRLPCLSQTPGACSNSCPLHQWCHPTVSSSIVPFSSCLQSFPAIGSFHMSQFFVSGGQNIGASVSASVCPMNVQDWFPSGQLARSHSPRDSEVFSKTQFKSMNSSVLSFLYVPILTSIHDHWKTIDLTKQTFVSKVMSLLFNILSRLVTAFLPRSKHLLITWLQSPSAMILEPKKIKSLTLSIVSLFAMEWWERMPQY